MKKKLSPKATERKSLAPSLASDDIKCPQCSYEWNRLEEPLAPIPFPVGQSVQGDLLYAAHVLHDAALRGPDDEVVTIAARLVDAASLALSRRKSGQLADADRKALHEMERAAMAWLDKRGPNERWTGVPLPPRAKVDREQAMTELLKVCAHALRPPKERRSADVALMVTSAVMRLFPQLSLNHDGTWDEANVGSVRANLAEVIKKRLGGQSNRPFDNEALAVAALAAFGADRSDARNWIPGRNK